MSAGTLAVAATLAVGTAIGAVAYQATSHHAPLPPASNVSATTPSRVAPAAALDPCLADPNDPACTVVVTLPPAAVAAPVAQAAPAAPAATPSTRGATAEARHGADDGPNHDANDDHGGDRSGHDDGSGRSGHDDGSGHDAGDDHGSDG
jgi:hypothetical protein